MSRFFSAILTGCAHSWDCNFDFVPEATNRRKRGRAGSPPAFSAAIAIHRVCGNASVFSEGKQRNLLQRGFMNRTEFGSERIESESSFRRWRGAPYDGTQNQQSDQGFHNYGFFGEV